MMAKLIPFLLFFMPIYALAQTPDKPEKTGRESYIYWGYHRNFYAPSDIHFQSSRYDFTMYDVKANDMPAKSEQYFKLHDFSVPQFNFRMGQELKNNWFLSLGYDHHKYRFTGTQQVKITGTIDTSAASYYRMDEAEKDVYTGSWNGDTLLYKRSFMDFHHSNGMNYIRVQLEKRGTIFQFPKLKSRIDVYGGVGAGAVICWTDFTFLRQRYLNNLHFSGIGISAVYGVRWVFNDRFFIQHNFQNGINFLFDIQLEKNEESGKAPDDLNARASQNIHYFERGVQVGYVFYMGKNKSSKKFVGVGTPAF
jgi:hypothetical protein